MRQILIVSILCISVLSQGARIVFPLEMVIQTSEYVAIGKVVRVSTDSATIIPSRQLLGELPDEIEVFNSTEYPLKRFQHLTVGESYLFYLNRCASDHFHFNPYTDPVFRQVSGMTITTGIRGEFAPLEEELQVVHAIIDRMTRTRAGRLERQNKTQ